MYVNANQSNWPEILPSIMAAMRATPSTNTTMFSPYKILLGEEMRLPLDTVLVPNNNLPKSVLDHMQNITEQFELTRDIAKQNIKEAQEKNKALHDKGRQKPTFHLGDQVLINRVAKTKGLNPKLQPKKYGPYYICDVDPEFNTYLIRDCATHKQVKSRMNAKRLSPYISANIRDIQPAAAFDEDDEDDDTGSDTDDGANVPDNVPANVPVDNPNNVPANIPDPNVPVNVPAPPNILNPTPPDNAQPIDQPNGPDNTPPPNKADMGKICRLLECKWYRGDKWYRTKFVDIKPSKWVREDLIPEEYIRQFHVNKTQKGKAPKVKKRTQ